MEPESPGAQMEHFHVARPAWKPLFARRLAEINLSGTGSCCGSSYPLGRSHPMGQRRAARPYWPRNAPNTRHADRGAWASCERAQDERGIKLEEYAGLDPVDHALRLDPLLTELAGTPAGCLEVEASSSFALLFGAAGAFQATVLACTSGLPLFHVTARPRCRSG